MESKQKINKYLIIIVVLLIIVIAYFIVKNNIKVEKIKELSIESDNQKPIAVCYDSYNKKDILYKVLTLGEEIAYSIDYGGELSNYGTMTFKDNLSDAGMAIIMNGYPNKTPEYMECADENEAYMATQMAIWEVMNRTGESKKASQIFRVDNVTSIQGKEEYYNRVISASKKLIEYAENNPYNLVPTMTIDNANVEAHDFNNEALIGPYTVNISGTDESTIKIVKVSLVNAPESARITDENGVEKTLISNGDTIYVKMNKSEEDTEFNIKFKCYANRKVGEIYEGKDKMTQDYIKMEIVPVEMEMELTIDWKK